MYDKGNLIQKINMKLCRKIIYFIYCYSNGRNDTLEHPYTSFYFVVKVIMLFINLITGMHFFSGNFLPCLRLQLSIAII